MFGGAEIGTVVLMKATAILAIALALACGRPATPTADQTPAEPSVVVTSEMGSPHPGDVAPDFDLVDQAGAHVKLADMRGSVVVLAFVTSFAHSRRLRSPASRSSRVRTRRVA